MILSDHAKSRFNERIIDSVDNVLPELERAYDNKEYVSRVPSWYYGDGQHWPHQSDAWIHFKDLDGFKAAALINKETNVIITVVKKDL